MSEKTRNALKIQKFICLMLASFTIVCLFLPLTKITVEVPVAMSERFTDYLEAASLFGVANCENTEDAEELLSEIENCSDILKNKNESGEYISLEIKQSFIGLLINVFRAMKLETNTTLVAKLNSSDMLEMESSLNKLKEEDFSELDVEVLKTACLLESFNFGAYNADSNKADAEDDIITKILNFDILAETTAEKIPNAVLKILGFVLMAVVIGVMFGFGIASVWYVAVTFFYYFRKKENEVVAYQKVARASLFRMLLFVQPYIWYIALMMLDIKYFGISYDVVLEPFACVSILVMLIGNVFCGIFAYFKNNSKAQRNYLVLYPIQSVLGCLSVLLLFNGIFEYASFLTNALSDTTIGNPLMELLSSFLLVMMLYYLSASGIMVTSDYPYSKNPKNPQEIETPKSSPWLAYAIFFMFALAPIAASIILKVSLTPDITLKIALGIIGSIAFPIIITVSAKLKKRINISKDEERKLLYGVPDDDYIQCL